MAARGSTVMQFVPDEVYSAALPPSSPAVGQLWRNTGVNPNELLAWTGNSDNTARAYAVAKSGGAVSFGDLSDDRGLSVTVKTIAQQAGSGTPSPTNPRTISGKQTVKVARTGKNILKPGETETKAGVTFAVAADGKLTASGTCTYPAGSPMLFTVLLRFYLNGQFTFSANNTVAYGSDLQMRLLEASGTQVSSPNTNFGLDTANAKRTFTLNNQYLYGYAIRVEGGKTYNATIKPQLEAGPDATGYEPYVGLEFTLTPPSPLYGLPSAMDTIDTGGNVQHLTDKIVLDGSGNWWVNPAWTANAFRWAEAIPDAEPVPGHSTVADILCSHFHANSAASIANGAFGGAGIGNGTEIYIGFADNSIVPFHDVSALKSWLAANPVTIVYKRATPLVESIAPTQIAGSDGLNTVTSDGAFMQVEYTGSGWAAVGAVQRVAIEAVEIAPEFGIKVSQVLTDGTNTRNVYTQLYSQGLKIFDADTGEMIGGLTMRDGEVFLFSSALADPRADGEFITRVVAEKIGAWVYQGIKMMHGNDNIVTMLAEVSPDNEYITSFEIKPTPGCSMHLLTSGGVYQPEAFANIFLDNNTLSMECGDNDAGISTSINLFPDMIMTVGHVRPDDSGTYNLGGTAYRWRRCYVTMAEDVSSDARLKQDTTDIDPEFIYKLRPRQYRLKSDPDKLHYGLIAQEVKAALDECGIVDADLYGDDDPENLSLCYTEMIAPLIATVQSQHRRIEALESRLAALEARFTKEVGAK